MFICEKHRINHASIDCPRCEAEERHEEAARLAEERHEETARLAEERHEEALEAARESDFRRANPGDFECPHCKYITLKWQASRCPLCRSGVDHNYWEDVLKQQELQKAQAAEAAAARQRLAKISADNRALDDLARQLKQAVVAQQTAPVEKLEKPTADTLGATDSELAYVLAGMGCTLALILIVGLFSRNTPTANPNPPKNKTPLAPAKPTSSTPSRNPEADAKFREFVRILPGDFIMGCSPEDAECESAEKPAHAVHISKTFEIGKFEVTQGWWQSVMGRNPSHSIGPNLPVESVSWKDVQTFIAKMNQERDRYSYRLPTEQEWEYAARGGTTAKYWGLNAPDWYDPKDARDLKAILSQRTRTVGKTSANPWGLYDTLGNVWEWTQDRWVDDYSNSPAPESPEREQGRALRGGACHNGVTKCATRVSARIGNGESQRNINMGFRLVRAER